MQMTHIIPTSGGNGSGTLRRGLGMVPPPDVTHHTSHQKSTTHDIHNSINPNVPQQTLINHSNKSSQLLNNSNMTSSTKLPQVIFFLLNKIIQKNECSRKFDSEFVFIIDLPTTFEYVGK